MVKTFLEFIFNEVGPMPPGLPPAAPMPGGPPPGLPPTDPSMGLGAPPMGGMGGGPMGGMAGPPMGGPAAPGGVAPTPVQLQTLDVWEVLAKIADGKPVNEKKAKPAIPPAPPMAPPMGGPPAPGAPIPPDMAASPPGLPTQAPVNPGGII